MAGSAEQPLDGGITNAGRVARVGPHVLRPAGPHTASVHAFLRAVGDAGFDGAPAPIGVDDDGRERLTFVEGDVPAAPYPDWCQTDDALASIAGLLRRLHDAARSFDASGHTWNGALADPAGGTVVVHNDVELSNVVFRAGVAVAFIDFELAAPGRPVYDLAHLARLCVPIEHELDRERMGWHPADHPARFRLVADAYGLDGAERADLLGAVDDALDRIEAIGRPGADAATGGAAKYDRRRAWWSEYRDAFADALTST